MIKLRKNWIGIILTLAALSAAAFVCERFISYQQWTLAKNGHWITSKSVRIYSVMGAGQFLTERQSLAQGRLNLSEWHGYNEVTYKNPVQINSLDLDLALGKNSYLWLFFDQDGEDRIALRASRSPDFPSGIYRVKPTREYIRETNLPLLTSSEMHIGVTRDGDRFGIRINDDNSFSVPRRSEKQVITLRSGQEEVSVRKFDVKGADHEFRENFKPPWAAEKSIEIFFVLIALAYLLWMMNRGFSFYSVALTFSFLCILTAGGLCVLDWLYYSPFYFYGSRHAPINRFSAKGRFADFERERAKIFALDSYPRPLPSRDIADVLGLTQEDDRNLSAGLQWIEPNGAIEYLHSPNQITDLAKNKKVMLIVGTSQTWGSGASRADRTWFVQLIHGLSQRLHAQIFGLNIGIYGSNMSQLEPRMETIFKRMSPAVVFLNVGNNDLGHSFPEFKTNMEKAIALAKEHGSKVVFSAEAQNFEDRKPQPRKTHVILQELAQRNAIPIVKSYEYFARSDIRDSGFLYWDLIHFDDWGHQLFADLILRSVDWHKVFLDKKPVKLR